MTSTLDGRIDTLRITLEQQYQLHTDQLTELSEYSRQPDLGGYDPVTLRSLMDTARQGIAETAHALRRMSEGTYGRCETCAGQIPTERLEVVPTARLCVPCQQRQRT